MDDHFDDEDDDEDDAGGGGDFSISVAAARAWGCAKRDTAKMAKGRTNTMDLSVGNMVKSLSKERGARGFNVGFLLTLFLLWVSKQKQVINLHTSPPV